MISTEDVELRLTAFSELMQLATSLETATGALLTRAQLLRRSLILLAEIPCPIASEPSPFRRAFRATSLGQFHVGHTFTAHFRQEDFRPVFALCFLVGFITSDGRHHDRSLRGVEATVILDFPSGPPALDLPSAVGQFELFRLLG